jgi:4'-phosphopantetheinyl transferase
MSACAAADLRIQLFSMGENISFPPALPSTLLRGEIQVWMLYGELAPRSLEKLKQILSEDERQRADRFRFDRDRNCSIASRGILRSLLGSYLGCDAREVRFRYSDRGKPELESPSNMDLRFNVAHSGDVILWGFTHARRIGIDVEKVRLDVDVSEIAERFFSSGERAQLQSVATGEQHEAFFRCWSRKEAYVKATGDGLSLSLDAFDVSISAAQPARLLETRPNLGEAERWAMHALDVQPGYAAAIVVERENAR